MPIKLSGATSGFAQLQAAAVASNNTLTLPSATATLICSDGDSYLATTTGNVGIGTASPTAKLQVVNATSGTALFAGNGNASLYVNYLDGGVNYINGSTMVFRNGAGSTEFARIDPSGNLQVGGTTVGNTAGYVNSRTNTRAWARWAGATGTIASSYNVSSVTRNSTGDYTVNYTTALADANYAVIGVTAGDAVYGGYGGYLQLKSAPTTSSCAITTRGNTGTYYDAPSVQIVVFGN